MITADYQEQALDFLTKTGTELEIRLAPNQHCPGWGECGQFKVLSKPSIYAPHSHGFEYIVTISRPGRKSYTFSFWSSINDSYSSAAKKMQSWLGTSHLIDDKLAMRSAIKPSAYDILACISGDINAHDMSLEKFCDNYGYDYDSRKAEKTYNAVCDQSRALSRLFTSEELEKLQEIQ